VRISVVAPSELGPAELAAWRAMQEADLRLASPFLAPEFTLAVARHRPGARVAVLEDDGRIVGFFPHHESRRVIGRPIGQEISDCQGLVHAPGLTVDARRLLQGSRLLLFEYDSLSADQAAFAPHHAVVEPSPVIDLRAGWPAYLEDRRRTGDLVRQAERKQRRMTRELGEERFELDDRDPDAAAAVRRWKSAQYERTDAWDRFEVPWIAGAVDDLLESAAPGCRAVVSTLRAGDRLLAAHLGLRSERVLAWWFPAYDVEQARHSAGVLLALRLAEAAAADGVAIVDLGRGVTTYKERLRNAELRVATGRVALGGLAPVRRAQLAATAAWRARRSP
jgi:CelD/BcsL family acetyltransferase involved in cellulose biosynthesis